MQLTKTLKPDNKKSNSKKRDNISKRTHKKMKYNQRTFWAAEWNKNQERTELLR